MRKIIAIVTILFYVFVFVFALPYHEARADTMAIISNNLIPAAAALMVAAGLSFATTSAMETVVRWWYSEAAQYVREKLVEDINAAVDGVMSVSSIVWESIRSWVQERFQTGINILKNMFFYNAGITSSTFPGALGIPYMWGDGWTTYFVYPDGNRSWYANGIKDNSKWTIVVEDNWAYVYWDGSYRTKYYLDDYGIEYTGAEVLSNPAWDLEGKGVAVPNTLDDLIVKTYEDVIVDSVPSDTTFEGIVTGILSAVNTLVDVFTDGLVGDLSGINIPTINVSLTDKFPFSLPWDVARLISLLNAPPKKPLFQAALGGPFKGAEVKMDLSKVFNEQIMEKIRFFELLAFCIGLAIITPRLIGGSR